MVVTNVNSGDVITAGKMNTKLEAPVAAGELAGGVVRAVLADSAGDATVPASTTYYLGFGGQLGATEDIVKVPAPYAGTVRNFRVQVQAQPASGSLVFTLRKNNADTAITATQAAGASAALLADTTNSVSVAAGDFLSLKVANNATGASAGIRGFSVELAV
jgi:hypothetical protein